MANNFSASFSEVRAREQQEVFYKMNVANQIADTSFASDLTSGDVLHRTYRSSTGYASVYTRGTDMVERTLTDTDETLTVNKEFYDFFYVDDHDKIQNDYNAAINYGKDGGEMLSDQIDADVLGEALNATSTVDDGSIGGTAGNGITLSTSNVVKTTTAATKKMKKLNIKGANKYGVISPEYEDILVQYGVARETDMGDGLNRKPEFMNWLGYKLYTSNNTTGTAVLSLATQPTASDTITIEGVTFTFVASPSAAGDVDIGSDVDATRVNLETLINAPSTTTAGGVALSTEDAKFFTARVSAVDSAADDTLTVTVKGIGTLDVSETLTDGTDTWTAAKQKQHLMFGIDGNPSLVVQEDPSISAVKAEKRKGYFYQNTILYGVKTFADNAKQMVNIEINSSSF
jgi:hypothetical protein